MSNSENVAAQGQTQADEIIARADPTFKKVTSELATQTGLRLTATELAQALLADMVLELANLSTSTTLENTLFSFLAGMQYAITDFKGQGDPLTLAKFHVNAARTSLFCSKHPEVPVQQVLNLIVSSRFPQDVLGIFNKPGQPPTLVNPPGMSWLWRGSFPTQEVAIVVCRDLPLEPRFYNWLAFAPADSESWRNLVRLALKEGRRDLIDLFRSMRPKEFKAMATIDYLKDLDPQERKRINMELSETISEDLTRLASEAPEAFQRAVAGVDLEKFLEALSPEQRAKFIRLLTGEPPATENGNSN